MYAYLRTLTWKPVTQHFKEHYLPVKTYGALQLYFSNGQHALMNTKMNEWAKVPLFIANTFMGNHYSVTKGPFVFKDGFDQMEAAHYLVSMLQYAELTPKAELKVDRVREQFSDWISYDQEVTEYLRHNVRWL